MRRFLRRPTWAVAGFSLLLAVPQSFAFERVIVGTQHFVECFGLMLGEPEQHAQDCLPNRVIGPTGSISSSGGGVVVISEPEPEVVVVTPEPEPEPEPQPEPEPEPEPEVQALGSLDLGSASQVQTA